MIRVCVVEDETLVREGIRSLLRLDGEIEVVAEARDGREGLRRIRETSPDVVLLDLRMPGGSGLDLLRALEGDPASPPCLVLTTFDDGALVLDAVRAGARGYLLKDVSLEQLTGAIRALARGETRIQPLATDRILRGLARSRPDFESLEAPDPLSARELEVLRLMAGGHSNREIAGALGSAEGTIKNHVSSVLSKLGVRDRTRAVLKAFEAGLI
ncbi:MAG: response regulator transcription factor [Acidobacteriota bacterium]